MNFNTLRSYIFSLLTDKKGSILEFVREKNLIKFKDEGVCNEKSENNAYCYY